MGAKLFLLRGSTRLRLTLPFQEADYADAEGACPECGSESFAVQGGGRRPSSDDRAWEADARSTCCGKYVGVIRAEVSTLFGVREDEAVLRGRCRVY